MTNKEQKFALITGASSGIGYAMAVSLSKRGYKVFGCSPKSELFLMKPLQEQYGVFPFDCDLTNLDDIIRAKRLIKEETGGKLHILYNNGGISLGGPAIEYDESELNTLFQVNVIGHINMTKHMADYVIAAKGTIVFTSSIASIIPLSWVSAYNATKAAIDMYAKTIHAEMKPFGVKVYSVITGGVNTAICDRNVKSTIAGSKFEVDGIYESLYSSANMSRNQLTTEEPEVYAEGIANKITSSKSYGFNIYKGSRAYILYLVSLLMPLFLIQWGVAFHFKQLKVFRNIRKLVSKKKRA